MKKLENNKVDEIGRLLVKSGSLSSRDLEAIVAKPGLFDAVRARVEEENTSSPVRRNYFRPTMAAFASVAIVAAIAVGFQAFRSSPTEFVSAPAPAAIRKAPVADVKKHVDKPDTIGDPTQLPPPSISIKAERPSTRPSVKTTGRPRQPVESEVREDANFYAISYAGDPNETERGGRVVRVDIPRSALFAMGVDIPLENEAETVKAELLIGNDGVTRAIRVIK
jgi:hypothetical protein